MRAAHARGLKIIIVSDTYFDKNQLHYLLKKLLPDDVMASISKIFCSCEHGMTKSNGLFKQVLSKIQQSAPHVLHVGDNASADFHGPRASGIHALHLQHHNEAMQELLRMQAVSGNMLDASMRHSRSLSSPFRGVLAAAGEQATLKPETALGYAALGPLLYSFAKFILADVEAMRQAGKKVKILFLMRDAHLPALLCEAIAGKQTGARVRISRFVAHAASFRTAYDVERYLADVAGSLRFDIMCKQLLLPEEDAEAIIKKAQSAGNNSGFEFIRLILRDKTLQKIFQQSQAYRQRLLRHLEKEAGIEKGDTLVFVDLGYTGTAQLMLEPIFREEIGMEVVGRYLLSMRTPGWEASRRGLLDPSWCDDRTLVTLINYIALVEQVCTSSDSSVVDFDEDGTPLFSDTAMKEQQYEKLLSLQAECIRFAGDAEKFFQASGTALRLQALRDAALSSLGRIIFMPTAAELNYLQTFEFDLNLGTKNIFKVFDQQQGLQGLRSRGLFFMEKNSKSMRTNYPAELRMAGIELSMLLMTQHRYGLEIRMNDLSLRRERLPVFVIRGGDASQNLMEALPTHDGYFSLLIPVGKGNFQIGVQFGQHYQWVQIDSAELIKVSALFGQAESLNTVNCWNNVVFDQMLDKGGKLFQCQSETALLMFVPPPKMGEDNHVLRIVFRPIVKM